MGHEIVLYRCDCRHCGQAEEELKGLAAQYGAELSVKRVNDEGLERLAGWATPVVYVNGIEISHYTMSAAKWKKALETPLERFAERGEVVDFDCYERERARGPEHAECAECCVNEIKLPMGILLEDGKLYQLAAGFKSALEHEALKGLLGRTIEITGDIFRWEGKCTLTVRKL